jgi:hypothetical protein
LGGLLGVGEGLGPGVFWGACLGGVCEGRVGGEVFWRFSSGAGAGAFGEVGVWGVLSRGDIVRVGALRAAGC